MKTHEDLCENCVYFKEDGDETEAYFYCKLLDICLGTDETFFDYDEFEKATKQIKENKNNCPYLLEHILIEDADKS